MCARACRSACLHAPAGACGMHRAWQRVQRTAMCAMYRADLDLGSLLAPSETEGVWRCVVPPAVVVSSCVWEGD